MSFWKEEHFYSQFLIKRSWFSFIFIKAFVTDLFLIRSVQMPSAEKTAVFSD